MKTAFQAMLAFISILTAIECFGETSLQGQSCQIFDEANTSHAKANSELGAIACLGFLHGRDRAWQIDFLRRIVEGKTAEILGVNALQSDLTMRMLRFDKAAAKLFENMTEEQRAPFSAYAYGVNQGLKTERAKNAYEFKHYDYQPDEWLPVHSIEIILLQAFDQTRDTFSKKIDEANELKLFGQNATVLFARDGLPWDTTIFKSGEYPTALSSDVTEVLPKYREFPRNELFSRSETGTGSNSWAIAPAQSATGHAYLANDPHLDLKHPSFWYKTHIEGGDIDVIGTSAPGVPYVLSGTTRHVSWGFTNSYFDVTELAYIPNADLTGKVSTWFPLVWVNFKGLKLPFFFKSFLYTEKGLPVLPLEGGPKNHSLILRWSGYDITPAGLLGMIEMMKAKNAKEADVALSHVTIPSWNVTFADTQGTIGARVIGQLPKQTQEVPFGIPVRSYSNWPEWTFLTADEAPHVLNPARTYIVTANNQPWPKDSALRAGRFQSLAFRAFRIEEMIKRTEMHNLNTIQKIQCDDQAVDARFLLPGLLEVIQKTQSEQAEATTREQIAVNALKQWDFRMSTDCRACAVWSRWLDRILETEQLSREALYRLTTLSQPTEELADRILKDFKDALDDLNITDNGELPTWGEIHFTPFTHFSGDPSFVVAPISTGGGPNSVSPGTATWDAKSRTYAHTVGASERIIVEMSTPPIVHSVLAGSNVDFEKPDLSYPQGPWMKWKRCELEREHFPLDWGQVQAETLVFQ